MGTILWLVNQTALKKVDDSVGFAPQTRCKTHAISSCIAKGGDTIFVPFFGGMPPKKGENLLPLPPDSGWKGVGGWRVCSYDLKYHCWPW